MKFEVPFFMCKIRRKFLLYTILHRYTLYIRYFKQENGRIYILYCRINLDLQTSFNVQQKVMDITLSYVINNSFMTTRKNAIVLIFQNIFSHLGSACSRGRPPAKN